MAFMSPPTTAAWSHEGARTGFEVAYIRPLEDGRLITGATTAVEDGRSWVVDYQIRVDAAWLTRSVHVTGHSDAGRCTRLLETDGHGRWWVDHEPAPHLDGCRDVDLESSALTNALPVHRLGLPPGVTTPAPAAYVRAVGLHVERLEQLYTRTVDQGGRQLYDYSAPGLGFSSRLNYDHAGLVLTYPGIASRAL